MKDEFEGDDKTLDWLDNNQLAEKDDFEAKQKGLEGFVIPIMMKVYQAAGGGGMECGMPGGMPFFAMYGGCSLGLDRGVRR